MQIQKPTIADFTSSNHDHSNAAGGGTVTNITGNAATATNATNVATTTKADNVNYFLPFVAANSSSNQAVDVGPMTANPSTSTITATNFAGNSSTVTGLAVTAGKTLTVSKTMSLTAADDTGSYTLPTGTKTLLATDGSAASLTSFPTLNQDTTGKSAKTDALNSATTVVNVSSATAPVSGQVLTATSSTAATWQTPAAAGASFLAIQIFN